MTAVLVDRTGDRATVRLTPSWLARLFGARVVDVELDWRPVASSLSGHYAWHAKRLDHYEMLRNALDGLRVPPLPRAIARRRCSWWPRKSMGWRWACWTKGPRS